jgi:hypothetical protein
MGRSAIPCTLYSPAEWHGRLGGEVQVNTLVDMIVFYSLELTGLNAGEFWL